MKLRYESDAIIDERFFVDSLHHLKCGDETHPLVRNQNGGKFRLTRFCITKNTSLSVARFHFFELQRMDDYGEDVGWDEAAVC